MRARSPVRAQQPPPKVAEERGLSLDKCLVQSEHAHRASKSSQSAAGTRSLTDERAGRWNLPAKG